MSVGVAMWVGTKAVRGRLMLAVLVALGAAACAAEGGAGSDPENDGAGGKADGVGTPDDCGYYEPAVGTATRTGVLRALHAEVDPTLTELGAPKFKINEFRVNGENWAWVTATLCLPTGNTCVDLTDEQVGTTAIYGESVADGTFGGNHMEGLVQKVGDTFEVRFWAFGANDAAYKEMAAQFGIEPALFYGCGYVADACELITEPPAGSAERALFGQVFHAEIDPTVKELGKPKFIYDTFRLYDGKIAYMTGQLCLPKGADCVPLTYDQLEKTQWREAIEEGVFDGNVFLAVVDARTEPAKVLDWAFGPTDAPQTAWADIYGLPSELVDGCGVTP